MVPNLASYNWLVVNTSGGKDSMAMLDRVVELADAAGVRDRLVVVHSDLGRVEWEGTRELAAEHAAHYGLRFEVVKRPQGDLLEQVERRGMWPSSKARFCTSDHKRDQVQKILVQLGRETGGPCRILNCMGIRADESPARSKRPAFSHNARASSASRQVDEWLPIHGWNTAQVWARIRQAGTRHHFAYDKGMPRLSCCFCIFAPKAALEIAAAENPALHAEYIRVEALIGHTFRQDLRIADITPRACAGTVADWAM